VAKSKGLSKSRLTASLQCQRRLWLAAYKPDLAEVSADDKRVYGIGHDVGDLARTLYGPGTLLEVTDGDFRPALARTRELIKSGEGLPIFEATFQHDGLLVRLDVLRQSKGGLELIEVKSSTQAKDYQVQDAAIQAWVVRKAGYRVKRVVLAVVDMGFVYKGDGDYRGLLKEIDITKQVRPLQRQVGKWVEAARKTLADGEPQREIGPHCEKPFGCPFYSHCEAPRPKYPVTILPHGGKRMWQLRADGYRDLREVPEERLTNAKHLRVWRASRSGEAEVGDGLREHLKALKYPRYYVDFEAVWPAIPYWAGTSPYEQVPFQWSCHREDEPRRGAAPCHPERSERSLVHSEFLATGTDMPARAFVESLIATVGTRGPVITYADYERKVLTSLAKRFKDLRKPIEAIIDRIEDLLVPMREHYYHPDMMGSWSIKSVLPTLSDLSYKDVGIVQDGGAATEAFAEMLRPKCTEARRKELRRALLDYCRLDTMAMVRVVSCISTESVA
jgi:hypothetical protein